jgi:large subunit ribosomal protein L12
MEYVYAGLLLHYTKKEINEENLEKIFKAIGAEYDINRIRMYAAALREINIEEAIKAAAPITVAPTTAPAATSTTTVKEEKEEEKKEEKVSEEELAAGLASLFG